MCLGNYRRSISLTKYYCVPTWAGCAEVIVNGNIQYTYLIRISARGLGASTGHLCLVLQSSGNPMLGGLKNCTDCKDFCLSVLQKFFLSVTLFSITTIQVSLMCRRSVDFHEPIYHRLLSRFYISETLFSFF